MDPEISGLLRNAKLAAAYGAASGAFSKDEKIFPALGEAVKAGNALTWDHPATPALQQALAEAVRAIRPVTLADLNNGWRADGQHEGNLAGHKTKHKVSKYAVLIFTIAVLFACASLTMWQRHAHNLVAEVSKNKAELQSAAYVELLPLLSSLDQEDIAKLSDPGSTIRLALREKANEIRALELAMQSDIRDYYTLREGEPVQSIVEAMAQSLNWAATRAAGVEDASAESKIGTNGIFGHDACADIDRSIATTFAAGGDIELYTQIARQDRVIDAIVQCELGIQDLGAQIAGSVVFDADFGRNNDTRALVRRLDVLGVWLLPTLYGVLGALIYHLRIYLGNAQPDPSFMKVILRVCLGGFAGVSIGWFWLPQGADSVAVSDITLATLTLSFLAGFSIDVFLNLLDRIVALMHGWVGSIGAPAK